LATASGSGAAFSPAQGRFGDWLVYVRPAKLNRIPRFAKKALNRNGQSLSAGGIGIHPFSIAGRVSSIFPLGGHCVGFISRLQALLKSLLSKAEVDTDITGFWVFRY
jgi:hypothetical protein